MNAVKSALFKLRTRRRTRINSMFIQRSCIYHPRGAPPEDHFAHLLRLMGVLFSKNAVRGVPSSPPAVPHPHFWPPLAIFLIGELPNENAVFWVHYTSCFFTIFRQFAKSSFLAFLLFFWQFFQTTQLLVTSHFHRWNAKQNDDIFGLCYFLSFFWFFSCFRDFVPFGIFDHFFAKLRRGPFLMKIRHLTLSIFLTLSQPLFSLSVSFRKTVHFWQFSDFRRFWTLFVMRLLLHFFIDETLNKMTIFSVFCRFWHFFWFLRFSATLRTFPNFCRFCEDWEKGHFFGPFMVHLGSYKVIF